MPEIATPPDLQTQIAQKSAVDIDNDDTAAALARIRANAGLPEGAESEVYENYRRTVEREIAESGESETQRRWINRKASPEAWAESEEKLTRNERARREIYLRTETPQAPMPKRYEGTTPVDWMRMSEREWQNFKEDNIVATEAWQIEQRKGTRR